MYKLIKCKCLRTWPFKKLQFVFAPEIVTSFYGGYGNPTDISKGEPSQTIDEQVCEGEETTEGILFLAFKLIS